MKKSITIIILMLVLSVSSCSLRLGDGDKNVSVTGVELSQTEIALRADKPDTQQLAAYVYPDDADVRGVEWRSDNESVAYVDNDGNVYPCGVGSAKVRVETFDGGFEAECAVTVTAEEKMKDIPFCYTEYSISLYNMVMEQMKALPISYDTSGADEGAPRELPAHDEEVEGFANPDNFLTGYDRYQFLVLNEGNGVSAETLDAYLNGKGVLAGKGDMFKKAADDNNISEVYLVLLSCIETENGTSELSNGMEVKDGVVYNMFGISEDISNPLGCEQLARKQDWTSPEMAIEGGARWLSENYLNNSRHIQNTLYKMRWNPDSPAANQYTADVGWADELAVRIGPMIEAFPSASWRMDIPVFEQGRAVAG